MLSGTGGLTLNAAGTLILSDASNSYTGGNTITAGTLSVGADGDLGAAANAVTLNGGTLATTATFASARTVTLGGGAISPKWRNDTDALGRRERDRRPDRERRGDADSVRRRQQLHGREHRDGRHPQRGGRR